MMTIHECLESQGLIVPGETLKKDVEIRWIEETEACGGVSVPVERKTFGEVVKSLIEGIGSGIGVSGDGRIKTMLRPPTETEEAVLTEK